MSAPPPGGPPPPQQPPTYPQYPPQYPPQQPYYPAPAPPPQKSNTVLIIIIVVVVIVVVLAILTWWAITMIMSPMTSTTQITVEAVSFAINYPGATHYFGPSPITTCTNCPIKTSLWSQFSYTLTLHNSDTAAHTVTGITLAGFTFSIVSSYPDPSTSSPTSIPAGGTQSFVLTIQPSGLGGTYTLSGVIDTA